MPLDHPQSIGSSIVAAWLLMRGRSSCSCTPPTSCTARTASSSRSSRRRGNHARPVVLLPDDIDYEGQLSAKLRSDGIDVRRGPLPVLRRRYARPRAFASWLIRAVAGWWWVLHQARSVGARAVVSNSTAIQAGALAALVLRRPHIWFVREIVESPSWFRPRRPWRGAPRDWSSAHCIRRRRRLARASREPRPADPTRRGHDGGRSDAVADSARGGVRRSPQRVERLGRFRPGGRTGPPRGARGRISGSSAASHQAVGTMKPPSG